MKKYGIGYFLSNYQYIAYVDGFSLYQDIVTVILIVLFVTFTWNVMFGCTTL